MQNKIERDAWVDALKKYVVMLDINDVLKTGRLLGKGNFARVFECSYKDKPEVKYALKTMPKKELKKNKRNIVSDLKLARRLICHCATAKRPH